MYIYLLYFFIMYIYFCVITAKNNERKLKIANNITREFEKLN